MGKLSFVRRTGKWEGSASDGGFAKIFAAGCKKMFQLTTEACLKKEGTKQQFRNIEKKYEFHFEITI